jgi:lactate racemase
MDWAHVEMSLKAELPMAIGSARRILLVVPDATRSGPIAEMVPRVLDVLGRIDRHADIIVASGTHPPMSEQATWRHLGLDPITLKRFHPELRLLSHQWNRPEALAIFGEIPAPRVAELTDGLLNERVALILNRAVSEYELLLILGPVFPHELVGFSGGSKYLFPGLSGREMVDIAHWTGALRGNLKTVGIIDTPIRRLLDEGMRQLPLRCAAIKMVVHGGELKHLFIGGVEEAWRQAAIAAGRFHIQQLPRQYRRIIACCPERYPDLWTGGKSMYRCEGAVSDGGELIIYAPHVKTFSETHSATIERVGYHVRDYFLANWERVSGEPRGILAYCMIVKGDGTYINGIESPRIHVLIASQITAEKCREVGLGYVDPRTIDPSAIDDSDGEVLVIKDAGETLYLAGPFVRNSPTVNV